MFDVSCVDIVSPLDEKLPEFFNRKKWLEGMARVYCELIFCGQEDQRQSCSAGALLTVSRQEL